MYALGNVKKFLEDHADRVGDRADGILSRAQQLATDGVLGGATMEKVFCDPVLTGTFAEVLTTDPGHIRAAIKALSQQHED